MRRALIALLAAASPTAVAAATPEWVISESTGQVQVLRAGISKLAARGNQLAPGDVVATGATGRAVLVRGEEFMMLAPSTRLKLPQQPETTGFSKVIEEAGNIVFMIKKKMTPHFSVETPYLAAVVKGTTFSIAVTGRQATVKVIEGAVDVATIDGGARNLLTAGATALVSADNRYRLRIEGLGAAKIIDSPAAPAPDAGGSPASETEPAAATVAAVEGDATSSPNSMVINEEPVSLAAVTDGLIKGAGDAPVLLASAPAISPPASESLASTGAGVAEAAKNANESSSSVTNVAELTSASLAARDTETVAIANLDQASSRVEAAATAQTAAADAAAKADAEAAVLADAAAKATADHAANEAARTAADQAAKQASDEAARLADEAVRAEQTKTILVAEQAAAQAAAQQAAAAATQAAEAATRAEAEIVTATDAGAKAAAESLAADARKAADEAAKAARKNADDAARAADQAARAEVDKAAKDAAKLAADKDAEKAARDAAKAAADAQSAGADKAAKEAEKAAKDAEKAAAKALADAAKDAEKAAKEAQKAAEDAAKDAQKAAEKAAKDAEKISKEAAKAAEDALKGKGKPGQGG